MGSPRGSERCAEKSAYAVLALVMVETANKAALQLPLVAKDMCFVVHIENQEREDEKFLEHKHGLG